MTICNMSIEAGARAGMIAPDETTFAYLKGRRFSPQGRRRGTRPSRTGATLPTDPKAQASTANCTIDAADARPDRHLGHLARHGHHASTPPFPSSSDAPQRSRPQVLRARPRVHGPQARHPHRRDRDRHRLPRLLHQRAASKTCAPPPPSSRAITSPPHVRAMVVPGSQQVKRQAEEEGLDHIFRPPASSGASPAAACASA